MRHSRRRRLAALAVVAGASAMLAPALHGQTLFNAAVKITDDGADYQLARNPNGAMAFAASGRLHLTYWSGGFTTSPSTPSAIHYRSWTSGGGWTPQETIDDSFYDDGSGPVKYGGRHSALDIAPDGTVWVVWQDNRHADPNPPNNGIDNIEIYADRKPPGGSFSSTDIRLTNTPEATGSNNGYLPKVAVRSDGTVGVVWYDFWADGGTSDLYARFSDTAGAFPVGQSMADWRLTNLDNRGGTPGYSVPDVAIDNADVVHAVWTSGFGGSAPVYYATVGVPPTIVAEASVATGSESFFVPAKLTAAPNGDLWLVWTALAGSNRNVMARRKPAGSAIWGTAIPLLAEAYYEGAADVEVGNDGILNVVWLDARSGSREVYFGRYSPGASTWLEQQAVSPMASSSWARPTLALSPAGTPHLIVEFDGVGAGELWFVSPLSTTSSSFWVY